MKILFVLSRFYPSIGATENCIENLATSLILSNNIVHVLCAKEYLKSSKIEIKNNIRIERIVDINKIPISSISKESKGIYKFFLFVKKMVFKILDCKNIIYLKKLRKKMKEMHRKNNYDWIISVSADIIPTLALEKSLNVKKAFYQVDPYSTNKVLPSKSMKRRLKKEKKIYSSFNLIFTTDLIKKELSTYFNVGSNIYCCGFPKIFNHNIMHIKNTDKIVCFYTGVIYREVRDPSFFYEIMRQILQKDNRFVFEFFVSGDLDELKELSKKYNNINVKKYISQEDLFVEMSKASFFINIGNNMDNQVPSKIFDYISFGKPIINFSKSEDSPTIKILDDYPLTQNIIEKSNIDECVGKVIDFCTKNNNKIISFQEIITNYFNYSIEGVKKEMMQRMRDYDKSRNNDK